MGIKDTIETILPPEEQAIKRWRQMMALLALAGLCLTAWSFGAGCRVGFGCGFAKADEIDQKINAAAAPIQRAVAEIKTEVDNGRKEQRVIKHTLLSKDVLEARENQCRAMQDRDSSVRFRTDNLNRATKAYKDALSEEYDLPSCRELGYEVP
jgi:hypothetical protein